MVMGTDQRYRGDLARRVGARLTLPRERVERLLAETARLHQICDEYEACRVAMERWRSIKTTGQSRLEEYEILSDDLEAEIVRWIANHLGDAEGAHVDETRTRQA
jgi:hypothetical protein